MIETAAVKSVPTSSLAKGRRASAVSRGFDFLLLDAVAGRSPLDSGMAHRDFRFMQP